MATIVKRSAPERVPTAPTKGDQHKLRWLGGYKDQATTIVLDVIAGDERRFALDQEIADLDAKLADPALAAHPLRPKAEQRRAMLDVLAVDAVCGRSRRVKEFGRIVGEMVNLIVDLSPAGREAAREIVGVAATAIDPAGHLYDVLGFPPDVPAWCVGKQAWNVWQWQRGETTP